jgi:recombination protein RecR
LLVAQPLQIAIEELSKLPGIGAKSAQRLALFLLKCDTDKVNSLAASLTNLKEKLRFCKICYNISEEEVCEICSSRKRNRSIICVVEEASDVFAVEKTNEFNGLYHVLGGVLSPLSGIDPNLLKVKELLKRLESDDIKEVILALNPDTEGEATSLYLAKLIKPVGIKVTRLARGLPIGGNLEFADEATIGRAVINRIDL